jgi:hypothetical protein
MKHTNRSVLCATAAIAAALALPATPLAAQSVDPSAATAPSVQPQPVEPAPPVASPAPTIDVPDVTAEPAASGASADVQPTPEASAPAPRTVTTTTRSTAVAPTRQSTSHTTVTRTTSVSHSAPAAVAAAPVAAVTPPANEVALPADAPLPADTTDAAPVIAANPAAVAQPNPSRGFSGSMAVIALGLLALIIALVAFMVFRRRSPMETEVVEAPATTHTLAEPIEPIPVAEPIAASEAAVTATPTMLRRRDTAPVRGALPSDGAAVDLPAKLPESYEERSALLDKMVEARPDKANPFTDKRQRMHRARLIIQSLGVTFDREPRIDLSQYPNNWPELQRQYHKAA